MLEGKKSMSMFLSRNKIPLVEHTPKMHITLRAPFLYSHRCSRLYCAFHDNRVPALFPLAILVGNTLAGVGGGNEPQKTFGSYEK